MLQRTYIFRGAANQEDIYKLRKPKPGQRTFANSDAFFVYRDSSICYDKLSTYIHVYNNFFSILRAFFEKALELFNARDQKLPQKYEIAESRIAYSTTAKFVKRNFCKTRYSLTFVLLFSAKVALLQTIRQCFVNINVRVGKQNRASLSNSGRVKRMKI